MTSAPLSEPRQFAALAAAAGIGALVALQTRVNGELATAAGGGIRGGLLAAVISFGTGLVLLCALACGSRMRRGLRGVWTAARTRGDAGLRWYQLVGGTAGALLVAGQGLAVPTLGVALFTIAVVAGQTSSGLLVDKLGIGPSGARALTGRRVAGAVITLAAMVLAVSGSLGSGAPAAEALAGAGLLLALLPLVAGAGLSFQQAVNGRVAAVGGPMAATWLNFVVGTAVLLLVNLVAIATLGSAVPGLPSPLGADLVLYTGGVIGVAFIALSAALVRLLGVLVLGLAILAGQVSAATALDAWAGDGVASTTVLGAALTLAGVAVAVSARRHRAEPATAKS